ncbi:hypothetical protein RvY_07853 [Ramazzottius varieornatus]|uniref:ELMO domain-containing protein n=1 Tax=Ramazzottius varieornatus TaxID=947166 RepID=A0A1D1V3W9_RAMVA|nr:hypothetical protein RvY_07853 [Ramazzottius varieornatus]
MEITQASRPSASNIAKIGVQFYKDDPKKNPQMVSFDQSKPLSVVVSDLCQNWSIESPGDFALQFTDRTHSYVTEKNRGEVKNGSVLCLCPSPEKNVESIVDSINMGDGPTKQEALRQLHIHASDITFAQEFINKQGIDLLINIIEGAGWEKSPATASLGEVTAVTLGCFLELMDHGIVSWDIVDQAFINKVASYVNRSVNCDSATIQSSLAILEYLLLNSSKQALVEKEISCLHLFQHLKRTSAQQYVLSYINAVFSKSSDSAREKLTLGILSPEIRNTILNDVIPLDHTVSSEIARQVMILQINLLNVSQIRTRSAVQDTEQTEKQIADLRKSTSTVLAEIPVTPNMSRKNSDHSDELSRLGFKNPKSVLEDLASIPEGVLVLDCMHFFATKKVDRFRQWILESFSRDFSECQFLAASVEVVRLLVGVFNIGSSPAEQSGQYDRVVFSSDSPFEDAYVLVMHTISKTWKEMKATNQDFPKVIDVLKEQVSFSLRDSPAPTTMEAWRDRIKDYNYAKVNRIREERRIAKEGLESKAEPMVELREMLRPEILALIAENRLCYMQKGNHFVHRERGNGFRFGDKRQSWGCRLSTNKKLLHYGDCDDAVISSPEDMPHVLAISDIKSLLTGKDCPHARTKKSGPYCVFSLVLDFESKKTVDFIAPNADVFHMWTDGLHFLLGKEMSSPLAAQDMEDLLMWEIKLRLLGLEGVPIPDKTPKMPPLPDNFDFKVLL